jgi:7-carboxy-7-deazaguanine synthase
MTVDQIMDAVDPLGKGILLLTGGEPLMQAQALDLMHAAIDAGRRVVLETGGTQGTAIRLGAVPGAVCRVVDVKTPGSGIAADQVDWEGIGGLTADDEIKMVVIDRRDYEWARDLVRTGLAVDDCRRSLPVGVPVAFSPAWGRLPLRDLAQWILHDGLPVRFQVQLHKVIWPEVERGV